VSLARHRLAAISLVVALNVTTWAEEPGAGKITPPGVDKVKVDAQTERVIEGSLKWLAQQQQIDPKDKDVGYWGTSREESRYPTAMTGYTLMAFMAAGNLPGEGKYGKVVTRGMNYLLRTINEDTGIFGANAQGQYMYGHGVATIALAELYGQTKDPNIRKKLQSVVNRIVASQNSQGGWRYRPVKRDADISVTVLQCVALRAAKNSGIDVPQKSLDNAVKYVKACFNPASGGFSYQPGSSPGFARTAAAIYSLQVCGLYDDDWVKSGSRYLLNHYNENQEWYVYGNFYAAPAQYMQGGAVWSKWYGTIKKDILKKSRRQGDMYRWDNVGRGGVGPIFSTSVFTMILAMPYHYIPLYQR